MPNFTGSVPGGLASPGARVGLGFPRIMVQSARLAPAAVLAVVVVWLMSGPSSADSILALVRFWAFGLTLPGLLLWRLATPVRHNLVEDFAAGALLGAAVLVLVYLASAPLGLQQWAWLWCAPVLVLAVSIPSWRRRSLCRVERPLGPAAAWLTAAACALPLYWLGRNLRIGPAPYTEARRNSPDMNFHQALAASAKYDFPLQTPYLDGERMDYHYFYHQLVAATSWATGIDLAELVYSIGWIPLLLAGSALIFALTDRLAPRVAWAGPLAIAIATIGGTVNAYPGVALPAEGLVNYVWGSPTQNLGNGLMVLLALLAVDLLRGQSRPGGWVLFLLVAAAASGSKATILPVAGCGLALVVAVRLCYGRFAKAALAAAVACAVLFGLAIVVIFGRHSSGMVVRPWIIFAKVSLYYLIRSTPPGELDGTAMWVTAIVTCLALTLGTAGLLVLPATGRRWLRDPGTVFLVGVAIAGFGGMVLTDQPGGSQLYFHRTAVPVIAALAVAGAWMLVSRLGDRRSGLLVPVAVAAGMGATAAARAIARAHPPAGTAFRKPDGEFTGLVGPWLWTVGLLVAGAILTTALWKLARRPGRPLRVLGASFVLAGMGAGLLLPLQSLAKPASVSPPSVERNLPLGPTAAQADAARWLRDHAAPGELIATNAHCAVKNVSGCDNRHFWIAALSERHVLVEGWGYTNTINDLVAGTGLNPNRLPLWDQQRLSDNDIAFTSTTRDNLRVLREKYGVHWLYVDPDQTPVSQELGKLATLRFSTDGALVYELP